MIIKIGSKKHIEEIVKLMIDEFKKPPFNEQVGYKKVLKSLSFYFKIGKVYVAIDQGKVVGVLVFKIEQYWEGPVIIIEDLAVKEKRDGKMLMNKIDAYARKNRIKRVLFTTHKKTPTLKLYQKLGYKSRKDLIDFEKKIR